MNYAEQTEVLRIDLTHLLTDYTDSSVHDTWTSTETSSTSPSAEPTVSSSIVGVNIQQPSHDQDQVKTSVNNLILYNIVTILCVACLNCCYIQVLSV